MLILLFLLGFSLHSLEEALWLPAWSKGAGKIHASVGAKEFRFAVMVVTLIGYAITFAFIVWGGSSDLARYAFFGFLLMMGMNAIFPHLVATIALRRYMPGTLTGLALNAPIAAFLVFAAYGERVDDLELLLGFAVVTGITLALLKPLLWLGKRLLPHGEAGENAMRDRADRPS